MEICHLKHVEKNIAKPAVSLDPVAKSDIDRKSP